MPLITVSMYPGRTQQQKEDFAKAVTKSATEILKTEAEAVIVVFKENPKENWFKAGSRFVGGCCEIGPEFIKLLNDKIICSKLNIKNLI